MRTEIYITIDTEFSIGGAFADPDTYEPVGERIVLCEVNGKEEGLGFLLATFQEYDVSATFFVEALNTAYFGDGPMGGIVERIASVGQDIQLHVHPAWLHFEKPDWKAQLGEIPPNDSCAGLSLPDLEKIFVKGIDAFGRWGLPKPIALRTGSLHADRNVYRALANLGIPLASNIGLAIYEPEEEALRLYGGRTMIEGVMEAPVLTYNDLCMGSWRRKRCWSITATSNWEMKHLLRAARNANVETIVVLTHPFEYIKKKNIQYHNNLQNKINQNRLRGLCEFVAAHNNEFVFRSFRNGADEWSNPVGQTTPLSGNVASTILRMVENKCNDMLGGMI